MPPPPLLTSPRLRQAVVSATMLGLLAMAMAMAWGYTRWTNRKVARLAVANVDLSHQSVGGFTAGVPAGWIQRQDEPHPAPGVRTRATFSDPADPEMKITLAVMEPGSVRSPGIALSQALNLLVNRLPEAKLQEFSNVPFRYGQYVGLRFTAVREQAEEPANHVMAVVTADGSRYAVVYLSGPGVRGKEDLRILQEEDRLVDAILSSVTLGGDRDATLEDQQAAGIAGGVARFAAAAPEKITALVEAGDEPAQFVQFVPTDGSPRLAVLRALGMIRLPAPNDADLRSPPANFKAQFQQRVGREPNEQELAAEPIGGHDAWRVSYPPQDPTHPERGMRRTVYYVVCGQARALLLELLCEPQSQVRLERWLPAAVKALGEGDAAAQPSSADAGKVEAVGLEMAKALRGQVRENPADVEYYLIRQGATDLGFNLDKNWREDRDPLPIRGRAMVVRYDNPPHDALEHWSASASLERAQLAIDETYQTQSQPLAIAARLRLRDGVLSLDEGAAPEPAPAWSVQVGPGFVPWMAEDTWTPELVARYEGRQGLVWLCTDSNPPWPCVMGVARVNATAGGGKIQWRVTMRPIMEMEGTTLRLSPLAQLESYDWPEWRGPGVTPEQVEALRVGRAELDAAFPQAQARITAWEKEKESDE